jgi:hypothetical protein
LHDELLDGLTQWLSEENVKILYNWPPDFKRFI